MYPIFHRLNERIIICVVILLFILASYRPAYANSFRVIDNSISLQFPTGITFHLSATNDTNITHIALLYSIISKSCVNNQVRQNIDFNPYSIVDLSWKWNLDKSGNLPPGAQIRWQWELIDDQNNQILTDVQEQRIEDPNYYWQKLENANLTLFWAKGDLSFGYKLLSIATNSLDRLEKKAGLSVTDPIQLIIYPSAVEMRLALVQTSEWAGGVAFPDYQIVLMGIGTDELSWANQVIPHEIAHLITGMRTFNCKSGYLPTWLNEGISEYAQGAVPKQVYDSITGALMHGTLPPLNTLAKGFSADSSLAEQSYNQSWMVVTYMIDTYGAVKLDLLLSQIQAGKDIDQGLHTVYGLDTQELDQSWRTSLGFGTTPKLNNDTQTPAPTPNEIPDLALLSQSGEITPTITQTLIPSVNLTATVSNNPSISPIGVKNGTITPSMNQAVAHFPSILWLIPAACFLLIILAVAGATIMLSL